MTSPYAIQPAPAAAERNWHDHFSIEAAIASVAAHVAKLASSRTPEQSTRKVYEPGLNHFVAWLDGRMPTPDLMAHYIAHHVQCGRGTRTINARYLAVARHFLRFLAEQLQPGLTGDLRDYMADCAMQMERAIKVAPAKKDVTSYVAPLWNPRFKRLSIDQVNAVLTALLQQKTLVSLRDYALLRVGFSTGLRLAELARISLASIREEGEGVYLLSVRGKRNNFDPVGLDLDTYKAILRFVMAYNKALPWNDARRIHDETPVWQPINRYGAPAKAAPRGLSHQALRDIIGQRTEAALGKAWRLSPHDLRRTCAALAHTSGMGLNDIRDMLRHADISTTAGYIGQAPDYAARTLAKHVSFV